MDKIDFPEKKTVSYFLFSLGGGWVLFFLFFNSRSNYCLRMLRRLGLVQKSIRPFFSQFWFCRVKKFWNRKKPQKKHILPIKQFLNNLWRKCASKNTEKNTFLEILGKIASLQVKKRTKGQFEQKILLYEQNYIQNCFVASSMTL